MFKTSCGDLPKSVHATIPNCLLDDHVVILMSAFLTPSEMGNLTVTFLNGPLLLLSPHAYILRRVTVSAAVPVVMAFDYLF